MTEKEYNDVIEWNETRELLKENEIISSELSFGRFVSIKAELFDQMVNEINEARIKNANIKEGVELIGIFNKEDFDEVEQEHEDSNEG